MKTKLIALIIIGVVLFGSFSFVYALMYDCLNPPAWIKMPKSDIRYCLGLLTNGFLPDYPTWEEYLASKENKPKPEPVRTPPPEPPFEKEEPFTKIEIMFGEKLNDGLVPVIFTEVTTNAETLDEIMVWNFELIGHSGDDRRVVWDTLPKDKRIWYEITDDDGQDIRIPENIAVPADQHLYEMDCGFFQPVEGESADPTLLQIKNNTSTIYAKNSRMGIYPDSNGEYSFEFASIFDHYVRFPEDAGEIISQESKSCKLTQNIEEDPEGKYTNGYYTKMVFRLEPELKTEQLGNFTLIVSNQSFDIDPVDIIVQIDGKVVIDKDFDVGNQHNYQYFEFQLSEGKHTIQARSEFGDAEMQEEFEVDEEKWAVLNFVYYEDEDKASYFIFEVSDSSFGFA